jgi:hypothetical protein
MDLERSIAAADPARDLVPQASAKNSKLDIVLHTPVGSLRSPRRWPGYLVVIAGALAMVGVLLASDIHTASGGGQASHHVDTRSAVTSQLDQDAVDLASYFGNPSPTSVTWVEAPANQATALLSHGGISATQNVYALQVSGGAGFSKSVSVPSGMQPASAGGPILIAFVDPTTWQLIGFGFSEGVGDVSSLGTPETDSLVGITPVSRQDFVKRFHVQ